MKTKLIDVQNLKLYFKQKSNRFRFQNNFLKAVDDVSFSIDKGETFGLVGESGSGKSSVGKCIMRQYELTGGSIFFDGVEIGDLKEKNLMPFRKKMQSIFQDPYSSLNPSKTVLEIVCEPMQIHNMYTKRERAEQAAYMLEVVGLKKTDLNKYPHEFSGGQRQRISIARALSVNPSFVLCDEPISALDVSMQAQIVNMLENLQSKLGLTYLFVSHQLSVVKHICNNIGVMYLGNLLEVAQSNQLYSNPLHPYTKMLLSSILIPDPQINNLDNIIPDLGVQTRVDYGCKFRTRCPYAVDKCRELLPHFMKVETGHYVACHLYGD
jgi:peptide/nickel transport system ATP-binding protein